MANKMKTYAILILLVIGLAFLGIGCSGKNESPSPASNVSSTAPAGNASATSAPAGNASAGEAQSITVTGSDTILPLAQAEAEAFMNQSSQSSISVTGGGSGVGISALIDGKTDIADSSRDISATELKNAQDKGVNPVNTTIAYDGITVIVNPNNKVSNLTFTQLRGIFNGSISNWKDVGGDDKEIIVVTRDSSSGTYKDFQTLAMQGDNYTVKALAQSSNEGIVQEVAQNPNAIGYIGFAYLKDSNTKALSLDKGNGSVSPTPETILDRTYPLSRALYMYTNGVPTGPIKDFIDFILSDKGQQIVSVVGYVPVPK